MKAKVFRLSPWLTYPDGSDILTTVRVPASSKSEAMRKVRNWYMNSPNPPSSLTFLSAEDLMPLEDYALDILWQSHPKIYTELWEPDIQTTTLLSRLKTKYPKLWEGLMKW